MSETLSRFEHKGIKGRTEEGFPVLYFADGTIQTTVREVVFGRGRIVVARYPNRLVNEDGAEDIHSCADDYWCYDSLYCALCALADWNPETEPEPTNWRKHGRLERYRILGKPELEYRTHDEKLALIAKYNLQGDFD